jgi:predicted dienelactone hydrolase
MRAVPSPPPPSLLAFAERGPHPVGVLTLDVPDPADPGRRLPTDVWFPADAGALPADPAAPRASHPFGRPHDAFEGAAPARGRFPLVAFSHGNSGLRRQSTFLTTHLASHGFVVAAPDHAGNTFPEMLGLSEEQRKEVHLLVRARRPSDLRAAVDAVLAIADDTGGQRLPALDATRIGSLGHSFGGWTALKLPRLDPRVRAVCGLAPASEPFVGRKAFEPDELPLSPGIPALLVAAAEDVLVDIDTSVRPLFARLAAPRALVVVDRSDHFHFCDGIALLHGMHVANPRARATRPTLPADALLDEARMHRAVRAAVTAFFAAALAAGADARDASPLGVLAPDALAALDPALRREPAEA